MSKKPTKKLVQDDKREKELIALFDLTSVTGRGGIDAELEIDNEVIQFEVKSTTRQLVSTARDIDLSLINRWLPQHWIIGFYNQQQELEYCVHATPEYMQPWIKSLEETLLRNLKLFDALLNRVDNSLVCEIVGEKESYSKEDVKNLLSGVRCPKELLQNNNIYSIEEMKQILKFRYEKMCTRGSTMNNPHINKSYFDNLTRITYNHATYLRTQLKQQQKINK